MIIEARDIRKRFGTLEVLKGIDFSAEAGEVVAIMGASGAGKSTLLQILGTLSTPDGGSLRIEDQDVLRLKGDALAAFRGRRIGFVFQAHHLLPEFSALENVMIPALIAGTSRKDAAAKAERLLGEVGLSARLDHKPSELSGGEQQRVAIARALINDPAVLFADEPTGNLDSATKQEIHRLLFDLRERLGQTIVIVTHDPELAALCDRCLTMRDGQFIYP
ncbi:MAG: ABC transporter ATP-binding protein [Bacteroidales bacterium]|nr:ABC transporter ATP-binding protein [Bacteroidales bacterium]